MIALYYLTVFVWGLFVGWLGITNGWPFWVALLVSIGGALLMSFVWLSFTGPKNGHGEPRQ